MGEVSIEIGTTDGYSYLGVQPPLTDEQKEWLSAAEYSDSSLLQTESYALREPDNSEPYSEAAVSTSADLTPADSHIRIITAAENTARVLRLADDNVHVDTELHPIGRGRHLFGGYADILG